MRQITQNKNDMYTNKNKRKTYKRSTIDIKTLKLSSKITIERVQFYYKSILYCNVCNKKLNVTESNYKTLIKIKHLT